MREIHWEFFQSKHGDNTCDAGSSHGQRHINNEPKHGCAPPKCAVEVIPLIEQIDKHSAELIPGEEKLPYIKVQTMDEIRSHSFSSSVVEMW